jgi:hypothetical protein
VFAEAANNRLFEVNLPHSTLSYDSYVCYQFHEPIPIGAKHSDPIVTFGHNITSVARLSKLKQKAMFLNGIHHRMDSEPLKSFQLSTLFHPFVQNARASTFGDPESRVLDSSPESAANTHDFFVMITQSHEQSGQSGLCLEIWSKVCKRPYILLALDQMVKCHQ